MDNMTSFEDSAMGEMALEKAKELFGVCDKEGKGFIIKRDMQRLKDDLPGLTPDQLEEVFESLDQDHNGFLTMEEFVKGFGAFLGLQIPDDTEDGNLADELEQASAQDAKLIQEPAVEQDRFEDLMDRLGASEVFSDQDAVQDLWGKLRTDEPELLHNFERFLSSVSNDMKRSKDEFKSLESALEYKSQTHDTDVQKLYEEMENQIKMEKEKILMEERERAKREREEMESYIEEKDMQLQELLKKQTDMQDKMLKLNDTKTQSQAEKDKLEKEREVFETAKSKMEQELDLTRRSLDDSRDQLDNMKKQTRDERRKRAQASFKVTEGIANEREDLVKQLDQLRAINKKLKDERDESRSLQEPAVPPPIKPPKKGSLIGPYLRGEQDEPIPRPGTLSKLPIEEEYECDEDFIPGSEEVESPTKPHLATAPNFLQQASLMDELAGVGHSPITPMTPNQERIEPLGGNEAEDSDYPRADEETTPDRIFKVVFVGDSGVGKTCFLHRFCHNRFKPTFSATIGVDFTVKSIKVGDRVVALQLWDTAGQERFRSITKQYFRKADGVVLMYDVTSELSFINLRNWVQSVREGVDDNCVLCLVGNKVDMYDCEETRGLKYKDGEKLADEFGTLFFETSAQTGQGIRECMKAMAIHLQEKEDKDLEEALKLEDPIPRRKKCCGKG